MVRQWRLISIVNLFGRNVNALLLLYAYTPGPDQKRQKLLSIRHKSSSCRLAERFRPILQNNSHRENEMHAICAYNFIYGFNTVERVAKRCTKKKIK